MLTLDLKHTSVTFPEHINELSTQQWYDLAEAYLLYQSNTMSFKALKVRLVYRFLNMRRSLDTSKDDNNQVLQNVAKLTTFIENLFDKTGNHHKIKLDFTANPLPQLKQGNKIHKGPNVLVSGLNFGNYVTAINAFNDYSNSLDTSDMHNLISALYPNCDPSQTNAIEQFIIYMNFAAIQNFLVNAHSLDIGGGNHVNIAQLFKPSNTKANTSSKFGMAGALYELAKEGTFGDASQVKKTQTWDVLVRMVQLHETALKHKRDAKNNRAKGTK